MMGSSNFDRERLSIMLELMEELSRVTQVFTLQRKFRFQLPKENVLKLGREKEGKIMTKKII